VRARDLRHWLATSVLADGYDPVTVAGRRGWSSAGNRLCAVTRCGERLAVGKWVAV